MYCTASPSTGLVYPAFRALSRSVIFVVYRLSQAAELKDAVKGDRRFFLNKKH
jgi:hypothetical protein